MLGLGLRVWGFGLGVERAPDPVNEESALHYMGLLP